LTKAVVEAGICGFIAIVEVTKLPNRKVRVTIDSKCEMMNKLGCKLKELDWSDALKLPKNSPVYNSACQHSGHPACPVPIAILKAIEVEVGVALPKDVSIRFEST